MSKTNLDTLECHNIPIGLLGPLYNTKVLQVLYQGFGIYFPLHRQNCLENFWVLLQHLVDAVCQTPIVDKFCQIWQLLYFHYSLSQVLRSYTPSELFKQILLLDIQILLLDIILLLSQNLVNIIFLTGRFSRSNCSSCSGRSGSSSGGGNCSNSCWHFLKKHILG